MISETEVLEQVLHLQLEAVEDRFYDITCIHCKQYAVFVRFDKGLTPGHIYSPMGMKEFGMSRMCEFCFDDITKEPDEEEAEPLIDPMPGQVFMRVPNLDGSDSHDPDWSDERIVVQNLADADIITSQVDGTNGKVHRPVIDIDFPVIARPSTNPEHSHLYIDKEMSWADYKKLLTVMVEVGLVEEGYLGASKERGFTAVRRPGKLKPQSEEVTHTKLQELLAEHAPWE